MGPVNKAKFAHFTYSQNRSDICFKEGSRILWQLFLMSFELLTIRGREIDQLAMHNIKCDTFPK